MTRPNLAIDEELFANDVHCRIADCRRRRRARARSQRSTLRTQIHPPIQELDEPVPQAPAQDQLAEREEALIT
jgi:hypothetical protein